MHTVFFVDRRGDSIKGVSILADAFDGKLVVVIGGTNSKKEGGFWSKNAIQEEGPAGFGFFAVLVGE